MHCASVSQHQTSISTVTSRYTNITLNGDLKINELCNLLEEIVCGEEVCQQYCVVRTFGINAMTAGIFTFIESASVGR